MHSTSTTSPRNGTPFRRQPYLQRQPGLLQREPECLDGLRGWERNDHHGLRRRPERTIPKALVNHLHTISFDEIRNFVETGSGSTCGVASASSNQAPSCNGGASIRFRSVHPLPSQAAEPIPMVIGLLICGSNSTWALQALRETPRVPRHPSSVASFLLQHLPERFRSFPTSSITPPRSARSCLP